jgi:hypothetical protein
MKREHLEILWEQTGSGCLGPPFQPVPEVLWEELVTKGIISDSEIPNYVDVFDPDNEYGDIGRRCFCMDSFSPWQISGFSAEELDRLHSEGKISIWSIRTERLARLTAEQWGIRPVFWEIDFRDQFTGTYGIGWKDEDTAVVITNFGSKRGSLSDFILEMHEEISRFRKELLDEAFPEQSNELDQKASTEESLADNILEDPESCKYLYVISIGSSYRQTLKMREELDLLGTFCLGTQDFLTEDGEPIWDARVKPRPVLVFNEAMKEWECDGVPLGLTPTESRIIKLLVQNSDRFTESGELFKVAWPKKRKKRQGKRLRRPEFPEGPLYTLISLLRIELESTGKLSIECTRGKGYRLIVHR